MKQMSFIPLDIPDAREQIRLCYNFARSAHFYHQELSVLNPIPSQFDPDYIFPRDMFLFSYHKDDQSLIPFEELVKMVEKNNAPMQCIGAHRPDLDRTMQLIWMPAEGGSESQLIVQILSNMSSGEKMDIIERLLKTFQDAAERK